MIGAAQDVVDSCKGSSGCNDYAFGQMTDAEQGGYLVGQVVTGAAGALRAGVVRITKTVVDDVVPDIVGLGPYAGASIPARSTGRAFTAEERRMLNEIGVCHTCGTTNPGTKSGNFVADHQPPSALNATNEPQRLYPQCLSCSQRQGLEIIRRLFGQ